ncbi:hypothetical protein BWI96_03550 [Siphonobacter sp. SORGH_AS_0500]|uniref:TatD family hydrolase n=1 Tax=Siphonobacter sp. SORGH_AS_0500 TaxID=1864824 RepID=UPI000CC4DB99|nr:TatD family hydrolase [Siphonobacter sp. SORGH_AS_0500]PKK38161.1 hypothetical protein BWI96_03550 [Siphonobacter sp. SORGH_AS_0500]
MREDVSFLDFHTHQLNSGENSESIYNARFSEFDTLPETQRISLGIHPWYIEENEVEEQLQGIERAIQTRRITTLGECGLDRLTKAPLSLQESIFERQLMLAQQHQIPVTIHCVRAFPELIQLVKRLKINTPLIVHGFNNKPEIVQQLQKYDFYFSLGKALLQDDSNAVKCLKMISLDRLFLETDDQEISISSIFAAASKHLNIPVSTLKDQIWRNFHRMVPIP